MRINSEIYKNDYLNIKNKNWDKERSSSYRIININQNYKDDNCVLNTNIEECKICYDTIWKNDDFHICKQCNKKLCKECLNIIKTYSFNKNLNCTCPYCRQIILKIDNNDNNYDDEYEGYDYLNQSNTNNYFRIEFSNNLFDILLKQFFILFIQILFIIIIACLIIFFFFNA